MRSACKLVLISSAMMALSSCGENKVKLDVARSLSDNAATTMTATAAYFDEAEARRRAALATLVARDASCLPDAKIVMQRPTPENIRGGKAPLCPPGGKASRGYQTYTVELGTTPEMVLKSRLLMISAVADYGRALAKILDDKDADVTGELTSFAEKVDRVGSLLSFIAGEELPTLGGQLESDEGKSVLALVEFIEDLQHEAQQVRHVEALVEKDGDKVDDALGALRIEASVAAAGTLRNYAFVNRNSLYGAYRDNRYKMSFAERRAAVIEILDAQAYEAQLPEKGKVVDKALVELQAAQQGMRDALNDKFTPAQRRKAAAINLDRITNALKMVAAVGVAFS
jgi:hypothetical protein